MLLFDTKLITQDNNNKNKDKMNELLHRELDSSDTLYYSIVNKESERGLTSNKRILLMV